MAQYSIPLEFKVLEREPPENKDAATAAPKRGRIKGEDEAKWVSMWIPWDDGIDGVVFLRHLQRELASVGLAATRDVERNLRARLDEYKILTGQAYEAALSLQGGPPLESFQTATSTARRKGSGARGKMPKTHRNDEETESMAVSSQATSVGDDTEDYASAKRSSSAGLSKKQKVSREPLSPTEPAPVLTRICVDCGTENPCLERLCKSCHADFTVRGKGGLIGKGKKMCRNCSAVIASTKRICPHCNVVSVK